MTQPGLIFREIHLHTQFAYEIQEQLDRIPRQIKAQKIKLEKMEKEFKEAQENIKRLKVSIHGKEVTLKELNTKITKLKKQQNEASDNKVYDALKTEIGTAKADIARTEDEYLFALTEQEEKSLALPLLEKALKAAKEDAGKVEKASLDRKADLEKQLAETSKKLKLSETGLHPDVLPNYQRIILALKHEALAPIAGKTCSACNGEITSQMQIEVRSFSFVACKSCYRILYLSEQDAQTITEVSNDAEYEA